MEPHWPVSWAVFHKVRPMAAVAASLTDSSQVSLALLRCLKAPIRSSSWPVRIWRPSALRPMSAWPAVRSNGHTLRRRHSDTSAHRGRALHIERARTMSQPQPPLDEQGEAREALNSAVTNYGPRILQNPQILGNVVTDLLPDLPREQNLLIAAAEADVATDLSQHIRSQNLEPGTAVQLAAHALAGKKSIDPAASVWVTTEYAKALGYDVPAYVPPPTPSPEAVPVPPPPSHSVPLAQSVPAPDAQAVPHSVPLAQSVPPPDAQAVPLAA